MTEYTADDFKRARFAEHPSGGVACKAGDNQPWIHPSLESDREFFLVDEIMAERGWAPVPAGSYTRTDEDTPEQYREAWQAAESAVLDEREMRKEAEQERDHLATVLATTARQRDEADKRNAHPLTPDAITDEMVERARKAWNRSAALGNDLWRDVLTAAIVPTRPEGAEEIEALVDAWKLVAEPRPTLPDFLAERGVRVVTEEQP